MEIKKPTITMSEDIIEQLKVEMPDLHQELLQEQSVKERSTLIKEIPLNAEHPLINIEPLRVFEHLEEEYNKVKDFSFAKLKIKDINKHITNIKTL